jgi:DNA repair exonuclease SbcCD ATPase subunit
MVRIRQRNALLLGLFSCWTATTTTSAFVKEQPSWSNQSPAVPHKMKSPAYVAVSACRSQSCRMYKRDKAFSQHGTAVALSSSSEEAAEDDDEHAVATTKSSSAADANAESYDLQRYRNRAALAERVLREKVGEGELLRGKLGILQHVVKQLQAGAVQGAAAQNETIVQLESEQQRLGKEWRQSIAVQTREWNQTRAALEAQTRQYQDDLTKLQEQYRVQKSDGERERQLQQDKDRKVQNRVQALRKEVLDMDQALETTQQELMTTQNTSKLQEQEMRAALVKEEKRVGRLREELEAAETSRKEALKELQNQTQDWEESTEIAKAAVAAAARREAFLSQDLQELKTNYTRVQIENDDLKRQMDELVLLQQDSPPAPDGTVDISESESRLRLEVDELQEQIRSLRSTHAAQLRMDQKTAQEKMAQLQEQCEDKVERIEQRQGDNSSGTTLVDGSLSPSVRSVWQRLKRRFRKR